jgi:hypothetical protein
MAAKRPLAISGNGKTNLRTYTGVLHNVTVTPAIRQAVTAKMAELYKIPPGRATVEGTWRIDT